MAVKRKYESERRFFKEGFKGDDFRSDRIKKAKYNQRKQRVIFLSCITVGKVTYCTSISVRHLIGEKVW